MLKANLHIVITMVEPMAFRTEVGAASDFPARLGLKAATFDAPTRIVVAVAVLQYQFFRPPDCAS